MPHKSIYGLIEHYYKTKKKQQYKITCEFDAIAAGCDSDKLAYFVMKTPANDIHIHGISWQNSKYVNKYFIIIIFERNYSDSVWRIEIK